MEENRKGSRKAIEENRRKSIQGSNKIIEGRGSSRKITTSKTKQPPPRDMTKHAKRIGSKNSINAYRSIQNECDKQNKAETSILVASQFVQNKPLRRIGKQKLVPAFVQQITKEEPQKVSENKKQATIFEPVITINKMAYEKSTHTENKPADGKQLLTSQNNSEANLQSSIIGSECETEQIQFVKTSSMKQEKNSFSINVKKIQSEEQLQGQKSREEEFSGFQKSDECIESLMKTDSDQGASNSDIVDGELNKLINQSFVNSQNQQDSKIEELLEEIQKNYSRNNQLHQVKDAKPGKNNRESQNYLMVPNNQRSSFPRNGKKEKTKQKQKKDNSEIVEIKQDASQNQQEKSKDNTQRSQTKKLDSTDIPAEKKEKLWKIPEKKTFQMWLEERKLTQKQKQQKKNQKAPFGNIADAKRLLLTPNQIEQRKRRQKLLSPQRARLLASDGPKKTIKVEQIQKISHSGVKSPTNFMTPKLTGSQVCLQSLKVKQQGQNSQSLHEKRAQKQKVLKKQSIAGRFKSKGSKIDEIHPKQQMKSSIPVVKRNNRQFQVNKCVVEARKIVSKISVN